MQNNSSNNKDNSTEEKKYTRAELEELIKELLGISLITPIISNQIVKFVLEYHMTYKEIARSLVYYSEVLKGNFLPQYGIAVVPNVREPANKYFEQLKVQQEEQKKEAKRIVDYEDNNIIIHIKRIPHKQRKINFVDISKINVEEREDE